MMWKPVRNGDAYKYTPKHVFATKNHSLSGATLMQLFTILYRNWRDVDWFTYGFRICFLTFLATINSVVAMFESAIYGGRIRRQDLNKRPIFILGHPRTGTTLIHNIMSKDPRLSFCTTMMCGFPSSFLIMEGAKPLLANIIDKTRPMDNMELHMDLPQEDELATTMLSGGISPYMPLFFMGKAEKFLKWTHFRDADVSDFQRWRESFVYFLKKVTFRNGGPDKRMVIKSPVHTGRVRLLLEMFPEAQFVYVHRDPYEVCQSAAHMADSYYWYCYFKKPTNGEINNFIFNQYEQLHKEYIATRSLIPKGNLVEVSFKDLEAHPHEQIRRIYGALGMPWDGGDGGWADQYVLQLRGFKKNSFPSGLPSEMERLVTARWSDAFSDFGYQKRGS